MLAKPGRVLTLADSACGTGGMLSVAEQYVRQHSAGASLRVFGQELNDETYATCRADMILKGQDAANIHPGNSFTDDGLAGQTFDYMLANPPFGVEWKKVADDIRHEHETLGFKGTLRSGPPEHWRGLSALPATHAREDEAGRAGRIAARDCVQRVAPLQRSGGLRTIRDSEMDR